MMMRIIRRRTEECLICGEEVGEEESLIGRIGIIPDGSGNQNCDKV